LGVTLLLTACDPGVLGGGEPWQAEADAGVPWPEPEYSDGEVLEPDGGIYMDAVPVPEPDAAVSTAPTSSCPRVKITTNGAPANVRPTPDKSSSPVGTLANGAIVTVLAIAQGQTLDGKSTWYKVKSGSLVGYVFETLAKCTTQQPSTFKGFYLPFRCGKKVRVSQGNNTGFSHTGKSRYAFDFSVAKGTAVKAMAPGKVVHVYKKTKPGDPCYNGGGPSCVTKANVVWVKHPDGTKTIYAHLSSVKVSLNQKVNQGEKLGESGNTGYSTGPHLHTGRMKACCQTIPLKFKDVSGTGVPKTGQYVTSGNNCP
jgi:hypothetical protein